MNKTELDFINETFTITFRASAHRSLVFGSGIAVRLLKIMPALKRRTKVVIFRLTDDEYHDLKAACLTRGARNVSDFARNALMQSVTQEHEIVSEKLAQIESSVNRLERLMHGIAQREPEGQQTTHN